MNTTTKTNRTKWTIRAINLIEMDADQRVTNSPAVILQLMREFGCSGDRAATATSKAARVIRYIADGKFESPAIALGRMTSPLKAAASRANGKRGGRPRKRAEAQQEQGQ